MAKAKTNGKGKTRGKRKSKAESMTGAKANEVEMRTAGIGDNSGDLQMPAPDDWNYHKKSIGGWREKVTTAQSGLRNAIKSAKKAGVNMESLNLVVGIERQNDPAKALDFFHQIDLGLSLSETTLRITPHDTLAGDVNEQAYQRGLGDAKAGRASNNVYPENSDLAAQYTKGFGHGTADNMNMPREEYDAALEAGDDKEWPDDRDVAEAGNTNGHEAEAHA